MGYTGKGPREWKPGMKPDVVEGDEGEIYTLRLIRKIKLKKDLPKHPDFKANAELAIIRKDPVELYGIYLYQDDRPIGKQIGELLWFPGFKRGGIATWETWSEGIEEAEWTDATNELDALERWVWGETKVDMGPE